MGILDTLIEELNKQPEVQASGGKWKRMNSQPVEIIDVKGVGRIKRPVKPAKTKKNEEQN